MAKAKLKLNSASIKEFLVLHVEKIVLGCMVLLVLFFIYLGSVVETFPTTKTPQTLTNVISTADANILQDTWPKVEPTVRPPSIVDPIVISVQPDPWQLGSLDPAILPSRSKRRDPKIYPPTKLVVDAVRAAAVFIPGDEEIAPIEEKYAEMTEVATSPLEPLEEKKPKKKSKSRPGSEMESMAPEMSLTPNPVSLLPRPLAEDEKLLLQGYRGSNAGVPRSRNAIVVKALVPFKKQLEEYLDALGGPSNPNFDAERDTPKYIYFWVERADVTDNPNADPKDLKWEVRSTNEAKQLPLMPKWEWE
ncbi:MAG TPA: hypothetical protein VL096_10810, partial [Pirellulaceae bacterium]|nr:hypothetical protein [Pirellulaceae bacterium]